MRRYRLGKPLLYLLLSALLSLLAAGAQARDTTVSALHTVLRMPIALLGYRAPSPVPPSAFRDDFSEPDSAIWAVAEGDGYALGYAAGAYRVRVQPDRGRIGSLPAIPAVEDVLVEVEARATTASRQAYGLIIHYVATSPPAYFAFVLSPGGEGTFAVFRLVGEAVVTQLGWTAHSAIRTGTATNHLRVQRHGQRATFWINGEQVASFSSVELQGASQSGLVALSWSSEAPPAYAEVLFDNFCRAPLAEGGVRLQGMPAEPWVILQGDGPILPAP